MVSGILNKNKMNYTLFQFSTIAICSHDWTPQGPQVMPELLFDQKLLWTSHVRYLLIPRHAGSCDHKTAFVSSTNVRMRLKLVYRWNFWYLLEKQNKNLKSNIEISKQLFRKMITKHFSHTPATDEKCNVSLLLQLIQSQAQSSKVCNYHRVPSSISTIWKELEFKI